MNILLNNKQSRSKKSENKSPYTYPVKNTLRNHTNYSDSDSENTNTSVDMGRSIAQLITIEELKPQLEV